jgi:isoamylase
VSYDRKHNEANGEENRDGADDNRSWNCGVEGPTDDPAVERLRTRQVKNFFTVTMLSVGLPMMLMGDEVRRTQGGNNNAYCQDSETSWFDWTLLSQRSDVHRFVTLLNARRVLRDVEPERHRVALSQLLRQADLTWHGVRLHEPDWGPWSRSVAFTARLTPERTLLHVILNAYWEPLDFELPSLATGARDPWRRWIDTFLDSPNDIVEWEQAQPVTGQTYRTEPRSVVVLFAGLEPKRQSATGGT